ncbi:hypothetical protein [Nodularia sp. LEGE 04288]|uniref:hypothetical protein n=1 Tax=Nodularia sp. LEGE 04288 TaxID=1828639 RepID=UPI001D0FC09F|nr:hypothetical protein [Nodularia sp. LEGE 04288]MCC2695335.1 hypothetical protein [Nodularia sp. LEGE 04288]
MPNFYTNCKTRLNKQGYKATKAEILLAAEHLEIDDIENATTENIIAGVEYLICKQSSELANVNNNVNSVDTADCVTELEDNNTTDELLHIEEPETGELETGEPEIIAPLKTSTELDTNAPEKPEEETPLSSGLTVSSADKQALVSTQSMALGFELSEQECLVVADSVDDVFSDYSSFLNSVTSAIRGYIDHRFDEVETALDTNSLQVREHIADRATRLNQKVNNFSGNLKADLGGIRQQIKSSKANILKRFSLPSQAR